MLKYFGFLLFSFDGRIGRRDFWLGLVASLVVGAVAGVTSAAVDQLLGLPRMATGTDALPAIGAFQAMTSLALMVWFCAVPVKRLHDRNKSASWLILWFLPVINIIALIELGFFPGTAGANDWGG